MQSAQNTITFKHFIGAILCKNLYLCPKQNKTITVKHHKDLYIAIKGTTTIKDWKHNLYFEKNDTDIHKGFSEYADECMKELVGGRLTNLDDVDNIIISSHSLGSCAAMIILYNMMMTQPQRHILQDKNIDVLMFGSPKPGGKVFVDSFTKMCRVYNVTLYRYVNKYDLIPNYPPLEGYSHVCDEIILDDYKKKPQNLYQEHCLDSYVRNILKKINL